jgi:predicted phosphodiesterase
VTGPMVIVPDCHLEPGLDFDPSYLAVRKFIADIQPDVTVILGDFGDFECFNHHDARKKLLLEGVRYQKTIDLLNAELDLIQRYSNQVCYCMGNHEDWVIQYVQEHPEVEGTVDLIQDLELQERGILWCERDGIMAIGKLNFTHGWKINKYHAEAMSREVGDHIFYGHTHDHQVYTPHFRKDQLPYASVSCGCLCSRNPSYMRRTGASRWINGFVYVEVRGDDSFNHHWIAITDGRFSFGGQVWAG